MEGKEGGKGEKGVSARNSVRKGERERRKVRLC